MRSVVQIYPGAPSLSGDGSRVAFDYGALAQLGERLICIQEVRSSILLGSTNAVWTEHTFRPGFDQGWIFDIVDEGSAA